MMNNKRALSPLIATVLLVVFALVIGTITMNWGKSYVDKIKDDSDIEKVDSAVVISIKDINNDLKRLQIQYITGDLTKEQYIEQEKPLING